MKIKKICVRNIRSYEDAKIEFPDGSILLSGDIGAGKTSVLLALEFALFGLQRGGLSGNGLLRAGQSNGTVSVELDMDGRSVLIERTLKRNKGTVAQDTGSITIEGERKELSANELKNRILQLLNYPQEFLTKTDILYKYTVYTPQESMREILLENAETRMDTLRKVFGIDKYKTTLQNISIFSRKLGEIIKNKEGQINDLDSRQQQLTDKEGEAKRLEIRLRAAAEEHERERKILDERKAALAEMEKRLTKFNELKASIDKKKSEMEFVTEQLREAIEHSTIITGQVKELRDGLKGVSIDTIQSIEQGLIHQQNEINRMQSMSLDIEKKIASLETSKKQNDNLINDVNKLDICPTCRQSVVTEHKHNFTNRIREDIGKINCEVEKYERLRKELAYKLEESKKKLLDLQQKEKEMNLFKLNMRRLEEKELESKKLAASKEKLQERHEKAREELKAFANILKDFSSVEADYKGLITHLDEAQAAEKNAAIGKAQTEKEMEGISMIINMLRKEICEKEQIKSNLQYLNRLRSWIQDNLLVLISTIEHEVMAKLHADFYILFEKWFSMFVSELSVRLDETFTPIIENRGYELDYSFLSGGERTAAALAYRLALNQVINTLVSRIRTRDILILDEPTDGFSSEQLDKMRDVFVELKVAQLIIVSHEAKMESFVDSVIHFQKDEGKTIVVSEAKRVEG